MSSFLFESSSYNYKPFEITKDKSVRFFDLNLILIIQKHFPGDSFLINPVVSMYRILS